MNKTGQEKDLSLMVVDFLAYKEITYKGIDVIDVKGNNVVIGYTNSAGEEKWVEYNLSFMLAFLYANSKGKTNSDEAQKLRGLLEQVEALEEKIKALSNPGPDKIISSTGAISVPTEGKD